MDPKSAALSSRAICIYGVKGCGKSVLAATLVAHLDLRKLPVGFFSFWAQSEKQRKVDQMLATLLWDLISRLSHDSFDKISPVALSLLNQHALSYSVSLPKQSVC
jgi:thymidylate kinase